MKKRHTETENYLKQALAKLLLEKNFEEVTVSDLTRTAGINRGTFYLHYVDKYDMADQFKNDTLDDLFHILSMPFQNQLMLIFQKQSRTLSMNFF